MAVTESLSNEELSGLDLSKVAALQQKRTLAFVNHFVSTTVNFLNGFTKQCEEKLMNFERQLEKVEAAMVLLEARLSSIPEVSTVQTETKPPPVVSPENIVSSSADSRDAQEMPQPETSEKVDSAEPAHPEYQRFLKMVAVGVPLEAVKLKVSLEGLDPDIFVKLVK